ncbi:unnamed protein product [Mycena citricolor]|uniref:Uncharacterized protein n=1 Tax=Mycena citricolor TaxID=2018698 RepID=A0AAD2H277_9AGAR|nr:unnamed protein product [Mycena citricolor]
MPFPFPRTPKRQISRPRVLGASPSTSSPRRDTPERLRREELRAASRPRPARTTLSPNSPRTVRVPRGAFDAPLESALGRDAEADPDREPSMITSAVVSHATVPSPTRPARHTARNSCDCATRIVFSARDGRDIGVPLGLAIYQEGMMLRNTSIEFCLPPALRGIEVVPFRLAWPGYGHLNPVGQVALYDPETDTHSTYADVAQQVAQMFYTFIQQCGDNFDSTYRGGVRLGPRDISFDRLFLSKLCIREGVMDAEIRYSTKS